MAESNPFPGLRPFSEKEDYLFFGREEQTSELVSLLRQHRFLAVVGTSGSGKSSLVRAGLIPALHRGGMSKASSQWNVVVTRPGGSPIENLAQAIASSSLYDNEDSETEARLIASLKHSSFGLVDCYRNRDEGVKANLLLIVDQFEELFRFHRQDEKSSDQASHFVNLLLEAISQSSVPIYVVITMRSDYLGDCSSFFGLAEAVNRGEYLVPRLNRRQLRMAILGPIQVGEASISNRLVQRLLNGVGDNPDQLPVLQHALMRTWHHWRLHQSASDPLDVSHFEHVGGMNLALSLHAGEVFDQLANDRLKTIAERVFKSITEKGNDGRETRRPTTFQGLLEITSATPAELLEVVEAFRADGCAFLTPMLGVPIDLGSYIDISHESLMRAWDRLKEWSDEELQSARIYRRLADSAVLHASGNAGLYRDPDLRIARAWREQTDPNAAWGRRYHPEFQTAMDFLDASYEYESAEERRREEARQLIVDQAKQLAVSESNRADEHRRAQQWLTKLAAGLAVLALTAVIACGASIYAFRQAKIAELESDRAKQIAQLTAAESDRFRNDSESVHNRLSGFREPSQGWEYRFLKNDSNRSLGRTIQLPPLEDGYEVGLSQDGKRLAARPAGGNELPILVYDCDTGKILHKLQTESSHSGILTFSSDNRWLAYSHWSKPGVQVYDLNTGKAVIPENEQFHFYCFLSFDPESTMAVVVDENNNLQQFSLAAWKKQWSVDHIRNLGTRGFRPKGTIGRGNKLLAVSSRGEKPYQVLLVDLTKANKPIQSTLILNDHAIDMQFFDEDKQIAVLLWDGTVQVYDVASSKLQYEDRSSVVYRRALSVGKVDGSELLATFDRNGMVKTYSDRLSVLNLMHGATSQGNAIAFDSENNRIVSAHNDGSVFIWDARSRSAISYAEPAFAFSPNSESVYFGMDSDRGTGTQLGEVDLISGDFIRYFHMLPVAMEYGNHTNCVAVSPSGKYVAVACGSGWGHGRIRVFDSFTGLTKFEADADPKSCDYRSIVWSSDGRTLAFAGGYSEDRYGQLRVVDVETDSFSELFETSDFDGVVNAVDISPNGKILVVACEDGSVNSWELPTNNRERVTKARVLSESVGIAAKCLAFLPNSSHVAIGYGDGSLIVWDSALGQVARRVSQLHAKAIQGLAVIPDGSRLASIDRDGAVKIFDTSDWRELVMFQTESQPTSIQFSPNGELLAIGTSAHGVILFDCVAESIRSDARNTQAKIASQATKEFENRKFVNSDWESRHREILAEGSLTSQSKQAVLRWMKSNIGDQSLALYRMNSQLTQQQSLVIDQLTWETHRKLLLFSRADKNGTAYEDAYASFISEYNDIVARDVAKQSNVDEDLAWQAIADAVSHSEVEIPSADSMAWTIVQKPNRTPEQFAIAYFAITNWIRLNESTAKLDPLASAFNTLALAEYRLSLFEAAKTSAKRSEQFRVGDAWMSELNKLLIANCEQRQGNVIECNEMLEKFDLFFLQLDAIQNKDTQALLRELYDNAKTVPKDKVNQRVAWQDCKSLLERVGLGSTEWMYWKLRSARQLAATKEVELASNWLDEVIQGQRQILDRNPDSRIQKLRYALALSERADILKSDESMNAVIELIAPFLETELDSQYFESYLFPILERAGRSEQIRELIAKLPQEADQQAKSLLMLAEIERSMGRYDQCLKTLHALQRISTASSEVKVRWIREFAQPLVLPITPDERDLALANFLFNTRSQLKSGTVRAQIAPYQPAFALGLTRLGLLDASQWSLQSDKTDSIESGTKNETELIRAINLFRLGEQSNAKLILEPLLKREATVEEDSLVWNLLQEAKSLSRSTPAPHGDSRKIWQKLKQDIEQLQPSPLELCAWEINTAEQIAATGLKDLAIEWLDQAIGSLQSNESSTGNEPSFEKLLDRARALRTDLEP